MDDFKLELEAFLAKGDYISDAVDCFTTEYYGQPQVEKEIDLVWFVNKLMDFLQPKIQDMLIEAWHSTKLWDALGMTEQEYDSWVSNGS